MTLPITSYEAERIFSKLPIIKSKFRPSMPEDRMNYLSFAL